ncbi:MAG TPA: N-acetylmuramoyl-L-alanine amidase [Rhodanobacteraceae bacterium]|nr:N-acetylmuramoyl-L-alanine amidase [Rhodanobacteraceae bacterium]
MRGTLRPWLPVFALICGIFACGMSANATADSSSTVKAVRIWSGPDNTRVVFELSAPVDYRLFQLSKPDRVVVDLDNGVFGNGVGAKPGKGAIKDMRIGRYQGKARIVLDLDKPAHPKSFLLNPTAQYGYRLVIDLGTPDTKPSQIVRTIDSDIAHGKPRPVVIAVDAGHGGDDPGARGQGGTLEKTVTLEIAKDLAKLIDAQPGMHAVLTRKGDYYVPLQKRFEIAREHKADLFVSIHANSCPDYCSARGASVWVLDTHGKQSEAGRWLARSENASDLIGGVSLDDKSHMLASVLLDLSQGASMHAAHEVGGDVLDALGKIGPLYRNTVQGANFVVLRSPDVPSILVETAFISNRQDEHRLDSRTDREQLAKAILNGVEQYFQTTPPPGTWLAEQRNQRLRLTASASVEIATNGQTAAGTEAVTPDPTPLMASAKHSPRAADAYQDMHKVARGETLSGIAQQYGVSMSALRSANASKIQTGGGIQAGQVLLIPNS